MRVVIKLSSQLVAARVWPYARIIIEAIKEGHEIIVVSGGAVKQGKQLLGLANPDTLEMQAASGIGQIGMMDDWASYARRNGFHTAQLLYTHHDLLDPACNAQDVIKCYFSWQRVLCVANGNDVAIDEETRLTAQISENSALARLLAQLINADLLVMLGLQKGVYTQDPRKNPGAQLIRGVTDLSDNFLKLFPECAPESGSFGGMRTNVDNCLQAARSGIRVVVASGLPPRNLRRILSGEKIGTTFVPART